MKVSLRWLSEFLNLSVSAEEVAARLTMAGIEVESITTTARMPDGIVAARIVEMQPHPNADRLTLCQLDRGDSVPLQVVCGAKNMKPGDVVPLATVGTLMPAGTRIEQAKLRGVLSNGMLCSARELGLSDEHAGLLILNPDTPLGTPLSQLYPGDTLLELSITANRADCLSMLGIARELSALFALPLKTQPPHFSAPLLQGNPALSWTARPHPAPATLDVITEESCPQYFGRVLEGVQVRPSPPWLAERLTSVGLRSINNIVDATNYIMLERGQPLHAFDLDRLAGAHITVRHGLETGEKLLCLDGVERTLRSKDLLICDDAGPVAIAGVMGGELSSVQPQTTRLFLEAAQFAPLVVRGSARRAGLHTDASHRFERGIDPAGVAQALDALTALLLQVAGGEVVGETLQACASLPTSTPIAFSAARVNRLLGMEIPRARMHTHLRALAMDIEPGEPDDLVLAPSYRLDIKHEADLAEEVARLEGYQHIPVSLPKGEMRHPAITEQRQLVRKLVATLCGLGLDQVINFTFLSPQLLRGLRLPEHDPRLIPVRLVNPLSEDFSQLRPLLLPSLLKNAAYNTRHQHADLALCEVGKVFQAVAGERPAERYRVGVLLTGLAGERHWSQPNPTGYDIYHLKGVLEGLLTALGVEGLKLEANDPEPFLAPGQGWTLTLNGEALGYLGVVHPESAAAAGLEAAAYALELDALPLWRARQTHRRFQPIPRFPGVQRDLALLVPVSLDAEQLTLAIARLGGALLKRVSIFDVYRGKNIPAHLKSVAVGLELRAEDRTLIEKEIQDVIQNILTGLKAELSIELRA